MWIDAIRRYIILGKYCQIDDDYDQDKQGI